MARKLLYLGVLLDTLNRLHTLLYQVHRVGAGRVVVGLLCFVSSRDWSNLDPINTGLLLGIQRTVFVESLASGGIIVNP